MSETKSKTILAGVMITAGSTIGAGMFSLPIVSSGMWFFYSLIIMIALWYLNYLSSLVLLEINLQYHQGSSFDTFVKAILGRGWNMATGIGIAFLLYILLYAYFSAFGNMVAHTIGLDMSGHSKWTGGILSLIFGGLLSVIVWKSTAVVGRLSSLLVIGMVGAFVISMAGLTLQISLPTLLNADDNKATYAPYIWATLPYFLTSFGFSAIVPSLYKHYGKDPVKIKKSILYGSLLALFVYALFLLVSFGIIPRVTFIDINAAGGNMGHLVGALTANSEASIINSALSIFSNFAIISSFLGVGLSLFDYIADRFSFSDDGRGRLYAACITFLPPGFASFFFPNGFIAAIGFAGLVMVFSYFIVPFLMVLKKRKSGAKVVYQLWGGKTLLVIILAGSFIVVICHILAMLNYLPRF